MILNCDIQYSNQQIFRNVKKRRFDRSAVIFKLKSKILLFDLKFTVERSKRRFSTSTFIVIYSM